MENYTYEPVCLYGSSVLWHSSKKGGTYNLDLDPQSKPKLGETSLHSTHTIVIFVPHLHGIILAPHRDHH